MSTRWLMRTSGTVVLYLGLFLILIVSRELGTADNGDFTRAFGWFVDRPVGFAQNWPDAADPSWKLRFFQAPVVYWVPAQSSNQPTWLTSAHVLWWIGYQLNNLLFSKSVVNLQFVVLPFFMIHALLYVIAIVACRNSQMALLCGIMLLLVFTDALAISLYGSFYSESITILTVYGFGVIFLVVISRTVDISRSLSFYWISLSITTLSIAFLLSKRQYLYFVVPFSGLMLTLVLVSSRSRHRVIVGGLTLLVLATTYLAATTRSAGPETGAIRTTSFHALYYGLLPLADDKKTLLQQLALPPESESLIGSHGFGAAASRFISETPQLSPTLFVRAILLEPVAYAKLLLHNAREIGDLNIDLGRVPGAVGEKPQAVLTLLGTIGSFIKGLPFLAVVLTVVGIALSRARAFDRPTRRLAWSLLLALAAVLVFDVLISTFDGIQEVRKHVIVGSVTGYVLLAVSLCVVCAARERVVEAASGDLEERGG